MDNELSIASFTADSDLVDSLKLDMSDLTPGQDKVVNEVANKIQNTIVDTYKEFIPSSSLYHADSVNDRVIVSDTPAFQEMYANWASDSDGNYPDKSIRAAYFPEGKIIAFDDPNRIWELYADDAKAEAIKVFGSEEKAKENVASIAFFDYLTHEICHQYQDLTLPEPFVEISARYYQRETLTKMKYGYIIADHDEERIGFYKSLIEKYGDDVHKLAFGKEIDTAKKKVILNTFTPEEIARLFPVEKR